MDYYSIKLGEADLDSKGSSEASVALATTNTPADTSGWEFLWTIAVMTGISFSDTEPSQNAVPHGIVMYCTVQYRSVTLCSTKYSKAKQNKAKQMKTKQSKTKQNKAKQNKTKQNKTKQNKTKQNKTKQK